MDEQLNEMVEALKDILARFEDLAGDPGALEQALGNDALQGITQDQYITALEQAMEEAGIPADVRGQVIDQFEAQSDYGPEGIQQHLTVVINAPQVTNHIDQSLDIHGEVHGDVVQQNESTVANALGEGSVAGGWVEGNQVQTGDGQQVGGDSGVQNQGDNSGQQAGAHAVADNVTTGDGNTVGSDAASRIGQGQVSQDYASINDSAQAFGEGAAHNTANDSYDSHDSFEATASATDSFNEVDYDSNEIAQSINVDEYRPDFDGYKPDVDYGHDTDGYKPDLDGYKPSYDDPRLSDHHDYQPDDVEIN